MKCPACDQQMNHRDRGGTEIDVCAKCRGVWLDATELDAILGADDDSTSVEAGLDDSAALPEQCRYCGEDSDPDGRCPACQRPVGLSCPHDDKPMYIVDAAGVELDRCPTCKGLWVDGFERTKLGKMREELLERAAGMRRDNTGETAAALIGLGTADGLGDGGALESVFAFGEAPEEGENTEDESDGGNSSSDRSPQQGEGQVRNAREYFDKYGGFEVDCAQCSTEVSRYTAWEKEGSIYCIPCAEEKFPGSTNRAMNYREPRSFSDSLEGEEHLLEVLGWLVGSIFRWRPKKR